jgi:hypothetical protein
LIEEKIIKLLDEVIEELTHAHEEALTWAHSEYHQQEALYKLHRLRGMFDAIDGNNG